MARRRDPRRYADRAKMRADEVARYRDAALIRKESQTNSNLNSKQWPRTPGINPVTGHTELSAMYDNDGNPIHDEPRGYFKG